MPTSNKARLDDWGRLVLRVSIGGTMLVHGVSKLFGGVGGIAGLLESRGLPAFLAYGVYVGEVIAPIMLILGFYARPAATILVFNMVVAILLAHSKDIVTLNKHGGWAVELPSLYLFGSVAIVLLGAGHIAVGRRKRSFQ